ncbi:MAG: CCA tRNA nucleotidyltransferase, partial [Phycisphaerales bacterium]
MATGAPKRVSERARAASEQAALQIIRVLRDSGFTAYLAGGCVRDVLLGLSPADYDVATSATPDQVLQLFDDAHEVGKAFGVVLVRFARGRLQDRQGRPMPSASVEIATFRREGSYSDKRRPDSVDFCGPEEDARRRDFTLNALFLDPFLPGSVEQQIIDTVGGLADLRDGIIRAVGDPEARLNEDHLRALRAVRFASRFDFEIEQGTAAAIRAHARCLTGVSNERVGDELRRMLSLHESVPGRRRAIHLIEDLQLGLPVLGVEASELVNPESGALAGVVPDSDFPTTLIAWVHDREGLQNLSADSANQVFEERAHTLRRQLVLSNEELSAFRAIAEGLVH